MMKERGRVEYAANPTAKLASAKAYRQTEKGKETRRRNAAKERATEHRKQYMAEYWEKYEARPDVSERRRLLRLQPERRQKRSEYNKRWGARPDIAKRRKQQAASPERREQQKAYSIEYRKRPEVREAVRLRAHHRRVLAPPDKIPVSEIAALYDAQRKRCAVCRKALRKTYEIDHIVPLSRGGPHSIANLQLLCPPCNRSKGAKDPIEFMRELGRLL